MDLTELKPTIVIYVGNGKYANYAIELEQLIEDIEQLTAERDFLLFATQKISDVLLPTGDESTLSAAKRIMAENVKLRTR